MSYDIKKLIPHRDPMLLVDEIITHEPFKMLQARSSFSADHRVFEGHFPGNPIMPGMLTLEMLAQAAACLAGLSLDLDLENTLYYFLSVDNAKFRKMVLPDDEIDVYIEAIKIRGKMSKFVGKAMIGDELAVEATFTAMIDEKKEK